MSATAQPADALPSGWRALSEDAAYGEDRQICTAQQALAWAWEGAATVGVTHVTDVSRLVAPAIPVAQAVRPHTAGDMRTMGKSLTTGGAVIGALMEAVERASAEVQPVDLAAAPRAEFPQIAAVEVGLLDGHGSESVFDGTEPWVVAAGVRRGVADKLVPFELVSTNWRPPLPAWSGRVHGSSNGLAAGFTRTTATLQGLCEVIERDAVTMWELGGLEHQARSRIAMSTVTNPAAVSLLRRFLSSGLRVGLWNLTSAIGVTVIQAALVSADPEAVPGPGGAEPNAGLGCHADPQVAIVRALTEAAQTRVSVLHGLDELSPSAYGQAADFRETALALIGAPASVSTADLPDLRASSPAEELDEVAARVKSVTGHPVLSLDLTRPDSPPVVKVIAPGTERSIRTPGWSPGPRARQMLGEPDLDGDRHVITAHDAGSRSTGPIDPQGPDRARRGRERSRPRGPIVAFGFADRIPASRREEWAHVDLRPPAEAGDVLRAAESGARALLLLDLAPFVRPRSGTAEAAAAMRLGTRMLAAGGAGLLIGLDLRAFGAIVPDQPAASLVPVVDEAALHRTSDTVDLPTLVLALQIAAEQRHLDGDLAAALGDAAASLPWHMRSLAVLSRAISDADAAALASALEEARTVLHDRDLRPLLAAAAAPEPVVSRPLPAASVNNEALLGWLRSVGVPDLAQTAAPEDRLEIP